MGNESIFSKLRECSEDLKVAPGIIQESRKLRSIVGLTMMVAGIATVGKDMSSLVASSLLVGAGAKTVIKAMPSANLPDLSRLLRKGETGKQEIK